MPHSDSAIVRFAVIGLRHFAQTAILPAFANATDNAKLSALVTGHVDNAAELSRRYKVRYEERGIGSALIDAAHRWMQDRGTRASRVVTQLANSPACRLYERSGYRLSTLEHYYHFWL